MCLKSFSFCRRGQTTRNSGRNVHHAAPHQQSGGPDFQFGTDVLLPLCLVLKIGQKHFLQPWDRHFRQARAGVAILIQHDRYVRFDQGFDRVVLVSTKLRNSFFLLIWDVPLIFFPNIEEAD